MTDILTDWRGQDIRVGDWIIYPVRNGSTVTIVEAVVMEFTDKESPWSSNTIIPALVVRPTRESRNYSRGRSEKRSGKNVTLTNLSLITRIA